jgi:hypothetical protein
MNDFIGIYIIGYIIVFIYQSFTLRKSNIDIDMLLSGIVLASFLSWLYVIIPILQYFYNKKPTCYNCRHGDEHHYNGTSCNNKDSQFYNYYVSWIDNKTCNKWEVKE